MSKGNYNVDLEHFLIQMIEDSDDDIPAILRHYEIDVQTVLKQLHTSLEKLPKGNTSTPAFSKHIAPILEQAWLFSSITLELSKIRSGSILYTLLTEDSFRGMILELCPLLLRIPRNEISKDIEGILKNTNEKDEKIKHEESDSQSINQLTTDLIKSAMNGKLDPIFGRETEIRQVIHILSRRRQNNPILVGDAGVGKTAIVEGLAQRIVEKNVHPILLNNHIYSLNMGWLLSGTGTRGEFEKRLKSLFHDLESTKHPSILFIDEAHMLLGAGGQSGVGDAANFLKPALARGTLKVIAATTWSEYKKYIEKDAALARRFERVYIKEPDFNKACQMLRLNAEKLEEHHDVTILNEAIESSVSFSQRFLPERRLPDKAIRVLDTSCARVKISQTGYPSKFKELDDECHALELEQKMLEKENINLKKIENLKEKIIQQEQEKAQIKLTWENECKSLQLDKKSRFTLIQPYVDKQTVASIICEWTGVPIETILAQGGGWTAEMLLEKLESEIFGQKEGLERIVKTIVQHQIGLLDFEKPIGVFFITGPSGVGKTQTALVLAKVLTGCDKNLVLLNMNDFQEPHTISKLKGAPPGYVGYGIGGTLTEAVRQNPYSVILMDEIDKAHPDVLSFFLQIFDKGTVEDSEGLEVDFRHALFILTSQDCADIVSSRLKNLKSTEDKKLVYETILSKSSEEVEKIYGTSLIARVNLIPYLILDRDSIIKIVLKKLMNLSQNLRDDHNIELSFSDEIVQNIADDAFGKSHGIRIIDSFINQNILPKITKSILDKKENCIYIE